MYVLPLCRLADSVILPLTLCARILMQAFLLVRKNFNMKDVNISPNH